MRHLLTFFFALLCFLAAPASAQEKRPPVDHSRTELTPWTERFLGVATAEGRIKGTRLLEVRAVRVDLRLSSTRLFVTPSNGSTELDTDARTTSDFLTEFGCQVAANGSVFKPYATSRGQPLDVLGYAVSSGEQYSKANRFHALLVDRKGAVRIGKPPFESKDVTHALSGYYTILSEGRITGSSRTKLDPRTVFGISKDGRYLILMAIDGRQPNYSQGATLADAAEWIKRFGAHNALNMDGGGSSTLVIQGEDGEPKLLNHPPGNIERLVANHLCVYAKPLRRRSK